MARIPANGFGDLLYDLLLEVSSKDTCEKLIKYIASLIEHLDDNYVISLIEYSTRYLADEYDITLLIYNLFEKAVKNKNTKLVKTIIDKYDNDTISLFKLINIVIKYDRAEYLKMIFDNYYDITHEYIYKRIFLKPDKTKHTFKYFIALGYCKFCYGKYLNFGYMHEVKRELKKVFI